MAINRVQQAFAELGNVLHGAAMLSDERERVSVAMHKLHVAIHETLNPPAPPIETALQEAQRLVHGDRQADYGHPFDDYTKTSRMVEGFLELPAGFIGPRKMALIMGLVKISREANRSKRDNRVDLAGYAECAQLIAEREQVSA